MRIEMTEKHENYCMGQVELRALAGAGGFVAAGVVVRRGSDPNPDPDPDPRVCRLIAAAKYHEWFVTSCCSPIMCRNFSWLATRFGGRPGKFGPMGPNSPGKGSGGKVAGKSDSIFLMKFCCG